MIAVKLDQGQKVLAYYEGLDRHKGYIKRKALDTQHIHRTHTVTEQQNLDRQVLAVGAEIAVHNYFGLDFVARSHPVADVGTNIEVRYSSKWSALVVRQTDKDTHYAVLVYGDLEQYLIVGYMHVAHAKTFAYDTKQRCWWIEKHHLQPIKNLYAKGYSL